MSIATLNANQFFTRWTERCAVKLQWRNAANSTSGRECKSHAWHKKIPAVGNNKKCTFSTTVVSYSSQTYWTIKTSSLHLIVFVWKSQGFCQCMLRILILHANTLAFLTDRVER